MNMYIWLTERERESEREREKERESEREREYLRNASYWHLHVVPSAVSLAGMYASTAKPALAGSLALPVPTGRRSAGTASLRILSIFTLANWIYAMWPIFIMGGGGTESTLQNHVMYNKIGLALCVQTQFCILRILYGKLYSSYVAYVYNEEFVSLIGNQRVGILPPKSKILFHLSIALKWYQNFQDWATPVGGDTWPLLKNGNLFPSWEISELEFSHQNQKILFSLRISFICYRKIQDWPSPLGGVTWPKYAECWPVCRKEEKERERHMPAGICEVVRKNHGNKFAGRSRDDSTKMAKF